MGARGGTAGDGAYMTVTDEGDAVVSLDLKTGRELWKVALPSKIKRRVSMVVLGERLFIAYGAEPDGVIAQLAVADGKLGWTRKNACASPQLHATERELFLLCQVRTGGRTETTIVGLAPKTGNEIARLQTDVAVEIASDGAVCTLNEDRVGCSTFHDGRLRRRWSRSVRAGRWDRLLSTAHYLLREDDGALEIVRLRDGRSVRTLRGPVFPRVDKAGDKLFLLENGDTSVYRLSDGTRLARLRHVGHLKSIFASPRWTLMRPRSRRGTRALLLERDTLTRTLADNLLGADVEAIIGDVLVTRETSWSVLNRERGTLAGYALSVPAPPAAKLDEARRVRAIVEVYHRAEDAHAALRLTQRVPHGLDHLEAIVREGQGTLALSAIGVAGVSHDLRFLPVLRSGLASIRLASLTDYDRERLRLTVHALTMLDDLQAATALHDFWRENEQRIPQGELREELRAKVHVAVWRYSAARDWDACPPRQFAVAAPGQTWGTPSPGTSGFVAQGGRWGVLCEARVDDDGNGKLAAQEHMGGGASGNTLRPYLILGSGAGTEIGSMLTADPQGKRVAVSVGTCMYLVDTTTGQASPLLRGDGRERADSLQDYPAADFSADGRWLAYVRSSGGWSQVVIRESDTGSERVVDPGPGNLAGVGFGESNQDLGMFTWEGIRATQTGDWIRSTSSRWPCSASLAEQTGLIVFKDVPDLRKRLVSVHDGSIRQADRDFALHPRSAAAAEVELQPVDAHETSSLPIGPFRVVPRPR
jgi:hypothetical protein